MSKWTCPSCGNEHRLYVDDLIGLLEQAHPSELTGIMSRVKALGQVPHPSTIFPLEELKADQAKREALRGATVLIHSGEHSSYWRPGGCGYTSDISQAGRYDFEDAWQRSSHCGPEKQIEFVVLN